MAFASLSLRALRISPLALALASTLAPHPAYAEDTSKNPRQNDSALDLQSTTVTGSAEPNGELPPAYAGGQVASGGQLGVLGDQDLMDVPFSLTSYTAQTIEDQQARTLDQVLANDASVRSGNGFGNASKVFTIRGLPLDSDDIAYNGLYGLLPRQIISTEAIERVEVFKGASAFLNGVTPTGTGIGGGINLRPKRAGDTPTRRFSTDFSSDGQIGEHLDVGQRFGADNRFGARLNMAQREGDTAIDRENQRNKLFALGLDYRGERLRLSTDLGYQKQRINDGRTTVNFGGMTKIPHAPSSNTNYGQPWAFTQLEDTFGMARAEYDLDEHWTLYVAGGAKHTREVGTYTTPTLKDSLGNATGGNLFVAHDEDNRSAITGLNGKLDTGPVSHRLNLGLAGIWAEQRSAFDTAGPAYETNIYHPSKRPPPDETHLIRGDLHDPGIVGKTRNRSLALSDTLGFFDDRLLFTAGLRRQTLETDSWSSDGERGTSYEASITTPVYGIVFRPWQDVSFYANRIEGLAAGPIAPETNGSTPLANASESFPPARSKQIEAGVKLDKVTYGASLAVYRIERPSDGYTDADKNLYLREGEQRNRGVELNLFGEPWAGLRLLAGATVMDSELRGTQGGNNDGNQAVGIPRFQYNLGADWDVPGLAGLALNARMLHTGRQYADVANDLSIPAWNRFDAGARYRFPLDVQRRLTLRANIENLANKNYWESVNSSNYLTQGQPRTLKLSATLDF